MELMAIYEKVNKLWDAWNLRTYMAVSLFLQVFLLFLALFRRRCKHWLFRLVIWVVYLLADWVARVAIGLITRSKGKAAAAATSSCDDQKGTFDQDFYAIWASFLLLHLGGPDTITSLALADNELWKRPLVYLIFQAGFTFYSFYLMPPKNYEMWLPSILIFLAGIIKFAERIRAFYLASLDHFGRTALPKPEPGLDYEEASTIYFSNMLEDPIQEETMMADQKPNSSTIGNTTSHKYSYYELHRPTSGVSDEMRQLRAARVFFERFKGLIVGFFLTSEDRKSSREYFVKADYIGAFRVIEYELSFMFQALHTKVVVVHQQLMGFLFRLISFVLMLGATLFYLFTRKQGFGSPEIILTCALLIGAVAVETISAIMLLFSDWTLVLLEDSLAKYIPPFIFKVKGKRWSRKVSQYNMINYCLDPRWFYNFLHSRWLHSRWLYKFLKSRWFNKYFVWEWARELAREILYNGKIMLFPSSSKVTEELKEFIFKDLKEKSESANTLREAMEACQQRGDYALEKKSDDPTYIKLKWSIADFQYAESLLLWHIATEICCRDEKPSESDELRQDKRESCMSYLPNPLPCCHKKKSSDEKKGEKYISKILSDYMFYLLIAEPTMLSPVLGDWHVVFQDTHAEAMRFFEKYSISRPLKALRKMRDMKAKFRPAAVKGTKSKSMFFDACILAHQLLNLEEQKRWKIMAGVWVEFMSYAAINCKPIVHAEQPSRGGELLTFTWLLMNHLGLGIQFSEQEEQPGMQMATVK